MAWAALLQGARSGAAIALGGASTTNSNRATLALRTTNAPTLPMRSLRRSAAHGLLTRAATPDIAPNTNSGNDSDAATPAPVVLAATATATATAWSSSSPSTSTSSFSSRDDEDTDAAEGAAGGGPAGGSDGPGGDVDPSLTASDLFDRRHLPPLREWPPDLLLYFPIGCALAAMRLAVWVACIALDLPSFRSRAAVDAYLRLLGVRVAWRHGDRIPGPAEGRHVLVSNHVSVGDLMMLFAVPDTEEAAKAAGGVVVSPAPAAKSGNDAAPLTPPRRRYVHLVTSALPGAVTATRHLPALLRPASRGTYDRLAGVAGAAAASSSSSSSSSSPLRRRREQLKQLQQNEPKGNPLDAQEELAASVHVFPEGGMTHGRRAMLSFSRGFTRLLGGTGPNAATAVVPVALRLRTHPVASLVRSHTLTSGFMANLFWFSFAPWTELEATALPAMAWRPAETGESRGAFVRRVQAAVAAELGCGIAALTVQQKRQIMDEVEGAVGGSEGVGGGAAAERGRR
jgi:hypothetical protein